MHDSWWKNLKMCHAFSFFMPKENIKKKKKLERSDGNLIGRLLIGVVAALMENSIFNIFDRVE